MRGEVGLLAASRAGSRGRPGEADRLHAGGDAAFDRGRRAIADIEQCWKREPGAARWKELKEALGELAA